MHCEDWVSARWAWYCESPWCRGGESCRSPCELALREGRDLLRCSGLCGGTRGRLRLRSRRASDDFAPPGTLLSPPTEWSPERLWPAAPQGEPKWKPNGCGAGIADRELEPFSLHLDESIVAASEKAFSRQAYRKPVETSTNYRTLSKTIPVRSVRNFARFSASFSQACVTQISRVRGTRSRQNRGEYTQEDQTGCSGLPAHRMDAGCPSTWLGCQVHLEVVSAEHRGLWSSHTCRARRT